jgi:hypothetical protein
MKPMVRRVQRLEEHFGSAERPLPRMRVEVMALGSKLCLEDAICTRTRCPNGQVVEVIEFQNHSEGRDEISAEEVDRWLDAFPIK